MFLAPGTLLNFYPVGCHVALWSCRQYFLQLPAYYLLPSARVVIPSSRMYLLLSKKERLYFVILQLVIIWLCDLIDFIECVFSKELNRVSRVIINCYIFIYGVLRYSLTFSLVLLLIS